MSNMEVLFLVVSVVGATAFALTLAYNSWKQPRED